VPAGRSFTIFLAGLTGTITPAKLGEVLKSGLLRRSYGIPVARSAPVVLAERVTDALGIALLTVLVGLGAAGSLPLVAVTLVLGLTVALLARTRVLDRFARVAEARAASAELLGPRLLVGMSFVAAASWFFECLSAWVCVKGLGLDVSLADTTVVFCIATLAGALSFVPGGLGVAEASMIGLFHRLGGVSKPDAAAVTVLIRLATLWFAVMVGLVALGVEDRLERRQAGGSPPARRSSIR
jgi:glycosyltransferase 2 family protein